jgi:D-alanyl-D-alanine carboxypeptidase
VIKLNNLTTQRRGQILGTVSLTAALVLAGCSSSGQDGDDGAGTDSSAAASVSLPSEPMGEERAAEIEGLAAAIVEQSGEEVPALLVGVWDPTDGFYTTALGTADLESGEAAQVEDAFRIGSVTKTFIATLVLQQVDEGSVDLDTPVAEYLPDLSETYPDIGKVTVRQLLAMQSGLPDFEAVVTGSAALDDTFTTKTWTAEELIDTAMQSGEVKPAGQTPAEYSNTNYIVLGELLEAVTEEELPDLVTSGLLDPFGLSRTDYPPADDTTLAAPFLRGYVTASGVEPLTTAGGTLEPNTDVTDWTASWGGAAGIMSSTLEDLATWAGADFGSALLSESLQQERTEFEPVDKQAPLLDYGLGLMQIGSWLGHQGGIPGWTTLAVRDSESGAIVVLAINSSGDVASLDQLVLLDELYPDTTGLAEAFDAG